MNWMLSVASLNPTLTSRCICMLVVPSWCDQGCCSQTVVVSQLLQNPSLILDSAVTLIKMIDSQAWQGQCEAASPTVCCLQSELVGSIHYIYMSCLADSGNRETNVLILWTLCPLQ